MIQVLSVGWEDPGRLKLFNASPYTVEHKLKTYSTYSICGNFKLGYSKSKDTELYWLLVRG